MLDDTKNPTWLQGRIRRPPEGLRRPVAPHIQLWMLRKVKTRSADPGGATLVESGPRSVTITLP